MFTIHVSFGDVDMFVGNESHYTRYAFSVGYCVWEAMEILLIFTSAAPGQPSLNFDNCFQKTWAWD